MALNSFFFEVWPLPAPWVQLPQLAPWPQHHCHGRGNGQGYTVQLSHGTVSSIARCESTHVGTSAADDEKGSWQTGHAMRGLELWVSPIRETFRLIDLATGVLIKSTSNLI